MHRLSLIGRVAFLNQSDFVLSWPVSIYKADGRHSVLLCEEHGVVDTACFAAWKVVDTACYDYGIVPLDIVCYVVDNGIHVSAHRGALLGLRDGRQSVVHSLAHKKVDIALSVSAVLHGLSISSTPDT